MAIFILLFNVCFIVNLIHGLTVNTTVQFKPAKLDQETAILEDETKTTSFNFILNDGCFPGEPIILASIKDTRLAVVNLEDIHLESLPSGKLRSEPKECFNKVTGNFSVTGKLVGRTVVIFRVSQSKTQTSNDSRLELYDALDKVQYTVTILRKDVLISQIFTISISILSAINTFIMGLKLDWKAILKTIKKPVNPAIGFVLQYSVMPLTALLFGYIILRDQPYYWLGYFVLGCSPGGGSSNVWTILLDGDLDLSVTMTLTSNLAAFAFMPLWLFTIGRLVIAKGTDINIPFANVVGSICLLIIPSMIGILVRHYRPDIADKGKKLIKFTSFFFVIFILTFGTYASFYIYLLFTWKTVLCGLLLPYTGFILAGLTAWLLKREKKVITTIAIETGIQNGGIAVVLLLLSLDKPDGDLAIVMPVSGLLFTPLPLLIIFIYRSITKCVVRRNQVSDGENATNATTAVQLAEGDGSTESANQINSVSGSVAKSYKNIILDNLRYRFQ